MFKHINRVVKYMVITDFFVNSAFGSFAPVFAIFITSQIAGGSAKVAGFAASIYWIVKSVIQLPLAQFFDRTDGDTDEFWAVFISYLAASLVPFSYLFITKPWQLYVAQAFLGVCMAFAAPAWYGLFTRHVDRWRISFEWSLESVFAIGLATALATAVGGYIADRFGFSFLFAGAGIIAFFSAFLLFPIRRELFKHPKRTPLERVMPERHPHQR
jgi:MFS family permease